MYGGYTGDVDLPYRTVSMGLEFTGFVLVIPYTDACSVMSHIYHFYRILCNPNGYKGTEPTTTVGMLNPTHICLTLHWIRTS